MSRFIIRLLINAAAIWVAAQLLDGISLSSEPLSILIVVLIFGLVNAILKPIFTILSIPFIIITIGLFTLVINAILLLIVAAVTNGLAVESFWWAVGGSIIISIVSTVLSSFLGDEDKEK
ncbi:MAG: phage holin family protein [Chloroflexota bacterium]